MDFGKNKEEKEKKISELKEWNCLPHFTILNLTDEPLNPIR